MSDLDDQLAARRADPEFRARLTERMADDAKVLQRLAGAMDDWVDLPFGTWEGANRYDTDNEHVLTLWGQGRTVDLRRPKRQQREADSPAVTDDEAAMKVIAGFDSVHDDQCESEFVPEALAATACDCARRFVTVLCSAGFLIVHHTKET